MPRKSQITPTGFGLRLKIARNRTGREVTHAEIATHLKISREAVTKWESKAAPAIKPENLFRAADFLGVRARWLATESGPMAIELPSEAQRLAEDFTALPVEYREGVRKYMDGLLAAIQLLPSLRRPMPDTTTAKYISPAPSGESPSDPHKAAPPLVVSKHGMTARLARAPRKPRGRRGAK